MAFHNDEHDFFFLVVPRDALHLHIDGYGEEDCTGEPTRWHRVDGSARGSGCLKDRLHYTQLHSTMFAVLPLALYNN